MWMTLDGRESEEELGVEGEETVIRIQCIKNKNKPLSSIKEKMFYHMPAVVEANELKHRASETGSQNEPFIFLNLSFRHLSQQQKANTV